MLKIQAGRILQLLAEPDPLWASGGLPPPQPIELKTGQDLI